VLVLQFHYPSFGGGYTVMTCLLAAVLGRCCAKAL